MEVCIVENIKDRKILLSKTINSESAREVITSIFDINYDDNNKEEKYKEFQREPIQLYINTFGGSVYDGLAIIDAIRDSKTPVHTYCIGSAMSMGLYIFLASDKRFVGKYSTFMYHEVATGVWDKLEGLKMEVKECDRLQNMLDDMVKEKTNIMQEQLNEYRERKTEWYINSRDAVKLGICHEII